MALERSADEATATVDDVAVNHQWSKSTECELGLRSVVRESVSASIEYCSGLRSCGELEIARWFADLAAYHAGFLSCNHAYRPGGASTPGAGTAPSAGSCSWCWRRSSRPTGSRPSSATTSSRTRHRWRDSGTCAPSGRKPYECVGEQRESLLAFLLLLEQPAWRDAAVLVALRAEHRGPPRARGRRPRGRRPGHREPGTRRRVTSSSPGRRVGRLWS